MDFPAPSPSPPVSPGRNRPAGWIAGLAAALLALYALFLIPYVGAVAGGSDSSGYMNHARMLASGRVHAPIRSIAGLAPNSASLPPYLYVPLGFRPELAKADVVPTYPPGLSLLIAAFEPIAGWRHAGDLVLILHSVAGILLTYLLGRTFGLGPRWSAAGAVAIAVSPLYLFMSLQAMSDVPALVWTTAAVIAAWRSRERPAWALAAGAMMGVSVLVRPTNALAFLPIAVALGASPRRWLLLVLGGIPEAAFFFAYSSAVYGSAFTTGYGDTSTAFHWSYIPDTLLNYAHWLPLLLTPLAVFALGLPWIARRSPRVAILLGVWIAAYAAFYSVYICTHETWWYLRFLLPAAPAILVAGLLVVRRLIEAPAARAGAAAAWIGWAAAVAAIVANGTYWNRERHAMSIGRGERKYAAVAEWVNGQMPRNAVLLVMQASGALFYYTDFTLVRYDALNDGKDTGPRVEAAARRSGRPIYAVLFPFEVDDALSRALPGGWTKVGSIVDVTVWRRDGANPGR